MKGRIYLIKGGNCFKIGSSVNVNKRLKSLAGASPVPLRAVFQSEIIDNVKLCESAFHRYFADQRETKSGGREWFRLSLEDIQWIQDTLALGWDIVFSSDEVQAKLASDAKRRRVLVSLRQADRQHQQGALPDPVEAIKFRIEQYGWSAAKFAEEIGMSRSHFSEVMNGKRKMPLHAVRKAVALGVPASVMLQPFPCEAERRNGKKKRT